jgi:dolichol-phosphate mannosyltransferase
MIQNPEPLAAGASAMAAAGPSLSVVICALNEHEAIGGVLDALIAELGDFPHEIIVVDDSADDRTARVVLARAHGHRALRLIRRNGAGGMASAAIAGWDAARGDVLAILNGDGQHDPRLIGRMADRMGRASVDVIVASRYLGAGGSGLVGFHDWLSRKGVRLAGRWLGMGLADPLSGSFVMTRAWYRSVRPRLTGQGSRILIDVVASGRRRPAVLQAPTALRPRVNGPARLDLRVVFDLLALVLEKRTKGVLNARMSQFIFVGVTTLAVHLLTLAVGRQLGAPFWLSQGFAIMLAMGWSFMLDNRLAHRDRQLRGRALSRGLLRFYAACAAGAFISEIVGVGLHTLDVPWLVAGAAGAMLGASCNPDAAPHFGWSPRGTARWLRATVSNLVPLSGQTQPPH